MLPQNIFRPSFFDSNHSLSDMWLIGFAHECGGQTSRPYVTIAWLIADNGGTGIATCETVRLDTLLDGTSPYEIQKFPDPVSSPFLESCLRSVRHSKPMRGHGSNP